MAAFARLTTSLPLVMAVAMSPLGAQGPAQRFTTGGREIGRVDIAGTAVGDFPSGIQMVDGIMEVLDFGGQRMLRASSRSTFLVRLAQVLPQDFTIEFEFVPKATGNPEDIAVEGTPTITQDNQSANIMWHRDYLQIVGGGPTYDSKVPATFAATLPATLTQVAITGQGTTLKLFTNGRLMYTQTRQFARSRVLRVFLGGQDDGPNAVYLAGMRVIDGVAAVAPIVAGGGSGTGSGNTGSGRSGGATGSGTAATTSGPGGTGGSSSGSTSGSTSGSSGTRPAPGVNQAITGGSGGGQAQPAGSTNSGSPNAPAPKALSASVSGFGVRLDWAEVPGATSYRVFRTETGSGQQGTIAPYLANIPTTVGQRSVIDPHVMPGVGLTYWVEAVFAGGNTSSPSPVATVTPALVPTGLSGPPNLQVSVGGTQSLQALGGAPGSMVTWTWNPRSSHYGYGVGVDLLRPNQLPQAIREYVFTPPISMTNTSPGAARYTRAIPQGVQALFCVFFWRTDDTRMLPADLPGSKEGMTCTTTQIP